MKANPSTLHRLAVSALAALAYVAVPALAGGPSQDVTVFGDSLSDPGNVFALTGTVSKAPYAVIPSAPYAIGGHHFSNGKTWDRTAAGGRCKRAKFWTGLSGKRGVHRNHAVGGARARATSQTGHL